MKKTICLFVLGLVLCAFTFAAETYVVEDVKGTVRKEVKSGEWAPVQKGDTLTEATVIDIKLQSELTVTSAGSSVTIKKMQKGTLSGLVASVGNAAGGVKIAGKASETSAGAASNQTASTATASARASDAAGDTDWAE